jgi:chlorobactene glucosyltransferase
MWLVRLVIMGPMLARRNPLTSQSQSKLPANPPKVSVLVAAKDEEDTIATCLTTLLAQDYPSLEIIAINDRSEDRTGEILADLALQNAGNLSVVTVEHLSADWYGKPHAMHLGTQQASGDYLLFTDADCVFDNPRAISIAVAHALSRETDFLTIIPALEAPTYWERILQPVCAIILMFWFQPDKVNDPRSRTAYANGAFMLIQRAAFSAIGGYEAVRRDVSEDTKLARVAKEAGLSLRVVENVGLYHTRMYETMRQALRGWGRIFSGALLRPGKLFFALLLLGTFSVGPWAGFFVSLMLRDALADSAGWAIGLWGASALLMQLTMLRLYGAVGFGRVWSLGYALGATGVFAILVSAFLKSTGATTTTWRNTTYRAGDANPRTTQVAAPVRTPSTESSAS